MEKMNHEKKDGLVYFVTTTIISVVVYIFMSLAIPVVLGDFDPVGMEGYLQVKPFESHDDTLRLDWKFGFKNVGFKDD